MTKISFDSPRKYNPNMPIFDKAGKVTERTEAGLENALAAYIYIANYRVPKFDDNPQNYKIQEVHIVGSGARSNKIDSDLDLLLIAKNLDDESAKQMKVYLAMIFFTDRPKTEAVDVFIRKEDAYPERESIDITSQVKNLLKRYTGQLDI